MNSGYSSNHMLYTSVIVSSTRRFVWWYVVQSERLYITINISSNLKTGILLFILSELILFSRFFWRFFNSYISIDVDTRGMPFQDNICIPVIDAFSVPLLNTALLLGSGVCVTWSHHSLEVNNFYGSIIGLLSTYVLRICFAAFQFFEYIEANFTISSGIWGSIFFGLTRFHRAHVFIRTNYLILNTLRMNYISILCFKHLSFLCIAWYWHFVDFIWVRLYILLYVFPVI